MSSDFAERRFFDHFENLPIKIFDPGILERDDLKTPLKYILFKF